MRYTDFTRKEMLTQGNVDQKKEIEVGAGLDGLRGADGGSKTSRNRCQVPERVKARCDRQQAKHSAVGGVAVSGQRTILRRDVA